ncbi:hypothetical protein C4K26_1706 [Pseudomonas chlororaphis]|nr:hypothetical protein C4K26_1706 [Pseudomonas chlororaphis]
MPLTFCNCIQVALRRVYSRRASQVNPFSLALGCVRPVPINRKLFVGWMYL